MTCVIALLPIEFFEVHCQSIGARYLRVWGAFARGSSEFSLSVTRSREDEKNIILQISGRKNTESCSGLTCGNKGLTSEKIKIQIHF